MNNSNISSHPQTPPPHHDNPTTTTLQPEGQQSPPQHNEKDIFRSDLLGKLSKEYSKLSTVRNLRSQDLSSVHSNDCITNKGDDERLILVSRSLPYRIVQGDDAVWRAEAANNNQAVQNLATVHSKQRSIWIGLSGVEVEPGTQKLLVEMLRQHRMLPIFLNQSLIDRFHTGFCRSVLWPLFHSSMPTTEDTITRHDVEGDSEEAARFGGEMDMWQAYKAVNQHFADAIQSIYQDGDLIWVHDYHFMLIPRMLKHVLPNARISFFLHLPFPSSEIYRVLPYREEILEGIVAANIIGFQTYDYARHFLTTIESLLEATCSPKGVEYNGHFAQISICPVGIIPEHWTTMARSDEVKNLMERWRAIFHGKRILLGVDILDPTKGFIHKLLAVEEMFDLNQKLTETVTFVQVGFIGSSSSMGDVDNLVSQIHASSAHINSKLGSAGEEGPVKVFIDVNPQELCAIYCIADVLVVTPLRDGMNVVPFEYGMCRESHGRLATVVLSEFAGCARSLGGALLVNPWNTFDLAQIMQTAMDIDEEERAIRHSNMLHYIRNFTSESWRLSSIADLQEAKEGGNRTTSHLLPTEHVVQTYGFVRWRLLVFSLERILMKETSLPELLSIPEEVVESLSELSLCPTNMVVVKSRRTREVLEKLLGHTNCVLAAECGAFVKWGHHSDWEILCPAVLSSTAATREVVEPVLQYYTERTPGSVIEIREASLAWHYGDCDIGHGEWQAKQLHVSLLATKGAHLSIFYGDNVLEVMPQGLCTAGETVLSTVVGRMRQLLQAHVSASNGLFWSRDMQGVRRVQQYTPSSLSKGGFFNSQSRFTTFSGDTSRGGGLDTIGADDTPMSDMLKDFAQPSDKQRIWPFVEVEVTGKEPGMKNQVSCMMLDVPLEWQVAKGIFYIDRTLNEKKGTKGAWQSLGMKQQQQSLWPKCMTASPLGDMGLSLPSTSDAENSDYPDIEFVLIIASGQEFNDEHIFRSISSELGLDIKDFVECVEELTAGEEDETSKMMVNADDGKQHVIGGVHPPHSSEALVMSNECKESGHGRRWSGGDLSIISSLTNSQRRESGRSTNDIYEIKRLRSQLQSGKQQQYPHRREQWDDKMWPRTRPQSSAVDSSRFENGRRMLRNDNAASKSTMLTDRTAVKLHRTAQTKTKSESNIPPPANPLRPRVSQDALEDSSSSDLFHDGLNRMKLRNTASQRAEIIAQSQFRPRKNFPPKTVLFQAMKEKLPSNCSHRVVPDTAAACWAMVLSTQDGRNESWREMQDMNVVQETSLHDTMSTTATTNTREDEKSTHDYGVGGVSQVSQYQLGHIEPKSFSKALRKNIHNESKHTVVDDASSYSPSLVSDTSVENADLGNSHLRSLDKASSPVRELSPSLILDKQLYVDNNMPSPAAAEDVSPARLNGSELEEELRLPMNTFSCTVGLRLSQASFYLKRCVLCCVFT